MGPMAFFYLNGCAWKPVNDEAIVVVREEKRFCELVQDFAIVNKPATRLCANRLGALQTKETEDRMSMGVYTGAS